MKNILLLLLLFAASHLTATPAPNFTVTTSDNQLLQLYQNFTNQGKLVVIEAFFTTCPPCNTHAPLVQNLYTQMLATYPGKVEFILLSTLSTDTNVKVAQYKTSKGLSMPAAGADGGSLTALQPYTSGQFGQFLGTPTFIVIAPNSGEVHFDIRGNSATQTMTLISQKIADLLPIPPPPPTYGSLKNFFDGNLTDVKVQVNAPSFDTLLMVNGLYSLSDVAALQNQTYTINPGKDDNPLNGITTYDLVLISKHILALESLGCDWQLLAADVNCSGSITTLDIVTARKLILGITQNLPCGSWRFVPDSASAANGASTDFLATKIGDVNGGPCDQLTSPAEDRSPLHIMLEDRLLEAGETAVIPVLATERMTLQGMQAAWSFVPDRLTIRQIRSSALKEFNRDDYNSDRQQEGFVPMAWINPAGQQVEPGETLLSLEVTAKQGGKLSELLGLQSPPGLNAEIYDAFGAAHNLMLHWQEAPLQSTGFRIQPNPAADHFTVSAVRDTDQPCIIQLFDFQGKMILENTFPGINGKNYWTIKTDNASPGLYCLRVNGESAGKVLLR